MVAMFVCQLNIKKILLFYFLLCGTDKKKTPFRRAYLIIQIYLL